MSPSYILGLDVGEARIGAAIASTVAKLPSPLGPIINKAHIFSDINEIIKKEKIDLIVVGLPRNLVGEETKQSEKIRKFADELRKNVKKPVIFVDESLSSVRAEQSMASKKNKDKISSDSLAACFILDEYFATLGKP